MTKSDPQWRILAASARGASHLHSGAPNQDAHLSQRLGHLDKDALVVAVADGHGDRRHFRSERGSRFAVESACRCAADATLILREMPSSSPEELARSALISPIVSEWRSMVAEDVAYDPFSEGERALLKELGSSPDLAYGSTLLIALLWGRSILLAQIGDGNAVVLHLNGRVSTPVPGDARLDGRQTTSLCQPDATDAFRVAAIDRTMTEVAGILLATDGFGNAQIADPWEPAVGSDLLDMVRQRGLGWIEEQLPTWVDECASVEGSADDVTVALVLTTETSALTPGPQSTELGDTVPATLLVPNPPPSRAESSPQALANSGEETVPVNPGSAIHRPTPVASMDRPPGEAPPPQRAMNRRAWTVATVAVVVAILVVFLLLNSGSSPAPGSPSTSNPSTTTVNTTPATTSSTTPLDRRHLGNTGSTGTQSPGTSPALSPESSPTSIVENSSTTTSTIAQPVNRTSATESPVGGSSPPGRRQ